MSYAPVYGNPYGGQTSLAGDPNRRVPNPYVTPRIGPAMTDTLPDQPAPPRYGGPLSDFGNGSYGSVGPVPDQNPPRLPPIDTGFDPRNAGGQGPGGYGQHLPAQPEGPRLPPIDPGKDPLGFGWPTRMPPVQPPNPIRGGPTYQQSPPYISNPISSQWQGLGKQPDKPNPFGQYAPPSIGGIKPGNPVGVNPTQFPGTGGYKPPAQSPVGPPKLPGGGLLPRRAAAPAPYGGGMQYDPNANTR